MAKKQLYTKKTTKSVGTKEEQQPDLNAQIQEDTPLEPLTALPSARSLSLGDLPLEIIVPNPFQARKTFDPDRLEELANAMREHGIISRIRVRKAKTTEEDEERYELAYGERRWRAARLAGLTHYPVEIVAYSDDEMVEIGLLENVQREDLTPLEEAEMYQRLLQQVDEQEQPRYSIRKLAERIGKDKSYVEMRLAVLRAPLDVQLLVEERPETPLRTAYEIGKVADAGVRETLLTEVREGKLQKVEQVKERVREATGKSAKGPATPVLTLPNESDQVPVNAIHPTGDVTQALFLFKQRMQKENAAMTDIFQRLNNETEVMLPEQRKVLLLYIGQWEQALMDLKEHLQRDDQSTQQKG